MFLDSSTALANWDLSKIVLAIGSLGTAAYGVVDTSKAFGGGISNRGLGDIKKVISQLIPVTQGNAGGSALTLTSVMATLRANWLNGMALTDQKAVAKALVKLNLSPNSAATMAAATGVKPDLLKNIAEKLSTGAPLTPEETDAYGRFDLLLTAVLDQGYQRGDQRYRNSAKLLAVPIAMLLALLGAWAIGSMHCLSATDALKACAAGLLATPLAPVAKDLASAIQAGTKVAQAWKK